MAFEATVIIPTRNRPARLRNALRSVLSSATDTIEVVVVDDGSTPAIHDGLMQDFADDPRLTVLRNSGPNGASVARNLGAAHARGKVLFFLDDDDLMLPGYCDRVLGAIAGRDLSWGFSPILHHGASGPKPFAAPATLGLRQLSLPLGRRHLTGLGCGFWVQRALFLSSGGLDATLRVNEDTEFCLHLLSLGQLPWVSDQPGVSVCSDGSGVGGEERSVTRSTDASLRASYFATMIQRYQTLLEGAPALRRFLVQRHLKTLAKTDPLRTGFMTARQHRIAGAGVYFLLNWVGYRLIRR